MVARRLSKKFVKAVNQFVLEQLEDRTLLTALIGGDVFEYQDANGSLIRVAMNGDIQADFIGAYVDDTNGVLLYDIPGHIYDSSSGRDGTDLLGGVGGGRGCAPVNGVASYTNITDPRFNPGSLGVPVNGNVHGNNAQINIRGLASNDAGGTYSFNVGTVTFGQGNNAITRQVLQLLQMNTATGTGTVQTMFQQGSLQEDVASNLTTSIFGVQDVAIDPTSPGLMYVLGNTGTQSQLYLVDRLLGTTQLVGSITNGGVNVPGVRAMGFDAGGQLYILSDSIPAAGMTALATVDKASGAVQGAVPVTIGGAPVLGSVYTAMTWDEESSTFLATAQTTGGTPQQPGQVTTNLHRITLAGIATNRGAVGILPVGGAGGGGGGAGQSTATAVEGLAFGVDNSGRRILVGIDVQVGAQGATQARLIEVDPVLPSSSVAISELGAVAIVRGLASVTEPGDTRPLLFSTNGQAVYRGSPVTGNTNNVGVTIVQSIQAADFDPATGLLYFVERYTVPAQGQGSQANTFEALFSVDVSASSRSAIQNSIHQITGTFGTPNEFTMGSIAFDPAGNLIGYAVIRPQGGDPFAELLTINLTNVALSQAGPQVVFPAFGDQDPVPILNITGIEFDRSGDLLTDPTQFVMAVTSAGGNSQILRVRLSTGAASVWGALPDVTDTEGPVRGQDVQSLAWNPAFRNPFTGQQGAMLATDATDDELLVVDVRLRPARENIYKIYVTRADLDSFISIAQVPVPNEKNDNPRPMQPFTGSSGSVRVIPAVASDTPTILVGSDGGTGTVFIGARLFPVPGVDDTGNEPVLNAPYTQAIGEQPIGPITDPFTPTPVLRPGLEVPNQSLLDFVSPAPTLDQQLLGQNLDHIAAMAIAPNGSISMIDTDHVNSSGVPVFQDELARASSGTGHATVVGGIYVATQFDVFGAPLDPVPLTNVEAMGYGDLNQDGNAELYAVYDIQGVTTLGQLTDNPDSRQYGRFIPIGSVRTPGAIGHVNAMAFANDGVTLYMETNTNRLLRVNPTNGAVVADIGLVAAAIRSMDFDNSGRLLAFDVVGRQLVDIDTATGAVGTQVQTGFGSLPTTVGAIGFDAIGNRWLAVDNSFGALPLANENSVLSPESAALMVLRGTTAAAVLPQDLGRFQLGGTITGDVTITGSIDTFYAGWVITGATGGQLAGLPARPNNFMIGGNARKVVAKDSFGGTGTGNYVSGFDMHVGGSVGLVRTADAMEGAVDAAFSPFAPTDTQYQTELEWRGGLTAPTLFLNSPPGTATPFQEGHLDGDGMFDNDTFATPEYLGTILSGTPNDPFGILVRGQINYAPSATPPMLDATDYYGVPLLAGQTITVQLRPDVSQFFGTAAPLIVGVFDPDGRLVATDMSAVDFAASQTTAFQVHADRPGTYRVAVAISGDVNFAGTPPGDLIAGYFLQVSSTGALGLGAVVADNNLTSRGNPGYSVRVQSGDLGALVSAGELSVYPSGTFVVPVAVEVDTGNLRVLDGGSVRPNVIVPVGSVGLVQGSTDIALNSSFFTVPVPVGRDYQLIQGGALAGGTVVANGAIGVIRVTDMGLATQQADGTFLVTAIAGLIANADGIGQDGIIDLIDVSGNLFNPSIATGAGGDVRYMRVGGAIFRDFGFGIGTISEPPINYSPGETVSLVDDSGAQIRLIPQNVQTNPAFDPNDPTSEPFIGPAITNVFTYPILGSGGNVLISFSVNGPLEVRTDSSASNAAAEIGLINVTASGTGVTTDALTGKPILSTPAAGAVPLNVGFTGPARIDVLNLTGGTFDNITNTTGGEIVNATIGSVGSLHASTLGVGISHTGAAVNPQAVVANTFPFLQQHTAIQAGTIVRAEATAQLGNFIVSGAIGDLVPDSNHQNDTGSFEGIVGPIQAGELFDVDLGAGLASSGSGSFGKAGLYATGLIHNVRNRGLGSDIRGDVVSQTGIQSINLNDGAIIGADIYVVTDFAVSRDVGMLKALPGIPTPFNKPLFPLQSITLRGNGAGIMGSRIAAANIGPVNVAGFGILNSIWEDTNSNIIDRVTAGGYGVRDVLLGEGASLRGVFATGDGSDAPTSMFTPTVRPSEIGGFDPISLQGASRLNDLHAFLGTSAAAPVIPGVTTTGVIQDVFAFGNRDLGTVQAFQIRASDPTFAPTTFNFANSIGTITTTSTINGLALITGKLNTFKPGGDVFATSMTIAGPITSLKINGSLAGNSVIQAIGPNGRIDNVTVRDDLNGVLASTGPIKKITVGRNIAGTLGSLGNVRKGNSINSLTFGGTLIGNLMLNGSIGTVTANSTLDAAGSSLTINGSIQKLQVRGNLGTNVHVTDTLRLLDVFGSVLTGSFIQADNTIGTLQVGGDTQAGSTFSARVLNKVKVKGANLATYRIG